MAAVVPFPFVMAMWLIALYNVYVAAMYSALGALIAAEEKIEVQSVTQAPADKAN